MSQRGEEWMTRRAEVMLVLEVLNLIKNPSGRLLEAFMGARRLFYCSKDPDTLMTTPNSVDINEHKEFLPYIILSINQSE
jgi:hypothetical protein